MRIKKRKQRWAKSDQRLLHIARVVWQKIESFYYFIQDRREQNNGSGHKIINLRIILAMLIGLILFFAIWFGLDVLIEAKRQIDEPHFNLIKHGFNFDKIFTASWHFLPLKMKLRTLAAALAGSLFYGFLATKKLGYVTKKVAVKQKGDSRFTTLAELKRQYTQIPDQGKIFKGYGGSPISHWKHKYFIDTGAVHNIVIGTSRSGKGQTFVLPMIDNLSRAQEQSSMVVNDPKGELYAAGSEILRKRGYDVFLLNMADGDKSMAYNPLQLILKAWEKGDIGQAMKLIRTLTYSLYHNSNPGSDGGYFDDTAAYAVNGMIIALISYNMSPLNFVDKKLHQEKVIMYNIADMMSELGMVSYSPNPEDPYTTHTLLDEYFRHLKRDSFAKKEYMSVLSAGDKTRDSIYSTLIRKLELFSDPKNAKMTSQNSLELKSIGFPKYLSFKLNKRALEGQALELAFLNKHKEKKSSYKIKPAIGGFVEYNFDIKLENGDCLEVKHVGKLDDGRRFVERNLYQLRFQSNSKEVALKELRRQDLAIENLKLNYSDKPTAVFMKMPDSDQSNNALATIFINQLYTELASQCDFVAGNKTIKRVHFILDEFGNMLPIKGMSGMMTVSAGRNILFTLIIQSYQQLYGLYGREKGRVIKENGQNQILIKSTDAETNDEFSKLCGNKTVEDQNVSKTALDNNEHISVTASSQPIILPDRVKDLGEGESIVLRALHRQDNFGRRVRAFPIFNTGKTLMPYAWRFLKEFNPDTDPNDLEIIAPHTHVKLKDLAVNWEKWITWKDNGQSLALKAYRDYKEEDETRKSISEIDQGAAKEEVEHYDHSEYIKFLQDYEQEIDRVTYERCLKLAQNERVKDISREFANILNDSDLVRELNKILS